MLAVALDIGGSHAACAAVHDRDLLAKQEIPTDCVSFRRCLPQIEELIRRVIYQAHLELKQCAGIVFGFPGIVDSRQGIVVSTNEKFNDATQLDLPGWSRSTFGLPLLLDNDARLALMGEAYCGAAQGAGDAVLVTIGTGIGAAAMLDGKPLRGKYDHAGCLGGHLPLVLNGRRCTCGNIGCAEAEASTWALPAICREWPGFAKSRLAESEELNFESLFSAADAGDQVATEVLARCSEVWSALAVALIHAYGPQVLLFGGGVMSRAAKILPGICEHVHRHAWMPRGLVKIRAAALGAGATLHGAVPLLEEMLG